MAVRITNYTQAFALIGMGLTEPIKKVLAELFKVSHPTVRKALKGEIESPTALRIRKAAIERGGIEKSQN